MIEGQDHVIEGRDDVIEGGDHVWSQDWIPRHFSPSRSVRGNYFHRLVGQTLGFSSGSFSPFFRSFLLSPGCYRPCSFQFLVILYRHPASPFSLERRGVRGQREFSLESLQPWSLLIREEGAR